MVPRRAKDTEEAVAAAVAAAKGDPLVAELRRAGLLPMLVLHFLGNGPSYGNQLMERVTEVTGGLVAVNPNTMYPLLRSLEAPRAHRRGVGAPRAALAALLPADEAGRGRARAAGRSEIMPHLDAVARSVDLIRREIG